MAKVLEEVLNKEFSRRDFLKGSVAATAAVAGLGFVGKESTLASAESVAPSEGAAVADAAEGGKWVAAGSVLAQLRRQVSGPCLCEGRRHRPSGH